MYGYYREKLHVNHFWELKCENFSVVLKYKAISGKCWCCFWWIFQTKVEPYRATQIVIQYVWTCKKHSSILFLEYYLFNFAKFTVDLLFLNSWKVTQQQQVNEPHALFSDSKWNKSFTITSSRTYTCTLNSTMNVKFSQLVLSWEVSIHSSNFRFSGKLLLRNQPWKPCYTKLSNSKSENVSVWFGINHTYQQLNVFAGCSLV